MNRNVFTFPASTVTKLITSNNVDPDNCVSAAALVEHPVGFSMQVFSWGGCKCCAPYLQSRVIARHLSKSSQGSIHCDTNASAIGETLAVEAVVDFRRRHFVPRFSIARKCKTRKMPKKNAPFCWQDCDKFKTFPAIFSRDPKKSLTQHADNCMIAFHRYLINRHLKRHRSHRVYALSGIRFVGMTYSCRIQFLIPLSTTMYESLTC